MFAAVSAARCALYRDVAALSSRWLARQPTKAQSKLSAVVFCTRSFDSFLYVRSSREREATPSLYPTTRWCESTHWDATQRATRLEFREQLQNNFLNSSYRIKNTEYKCQPTENDYEKKKVTKRRTRENLGQTETSNNWANKSQI